MKIAEAGGWIVPILCDAALSNSAILNEVLSGNTILLGSGETHLARDNDLGIKGGFMPAKKIQEFLDEHKIKYATINHPPAYTAQEIAASAHVPGKELAKTVIVNLDGRMAMVVLAASAKVNFEALKQAAGSKEAGLASEEEFKRLFPDCEVGAMPPFGNLYGIDVFASESLAQDDEIAFNAGSYTELIRLPYKEFERLVKPRVVRL